MVLKIIMGTLVCSAYMFQLFLFNYQLLPEITGTLYCTKHKYLEVQHQLADNIISVMAQR